MEIKWKKLAVKQLMDAIQYLEDNDLFEYAEKIKRKILSKIKAFHKLGNYTSRIGLKVKMMVTFVHSRLIIIEYLTGKCLSKLEF